jgi:signal transduction histidine kinase
MKRGRVWLAFAAGVALALGAVAALSRLVLRLDREGAQARQEAIIEENVRLALWRMDSALSLFLSRESLRPYFEFRAIVPSERPFDRLFDAPREGEVLVASPLLMSPVPRVQLFFQIEPDGSLTSPQVPVARWLDVALQHGASREAIDRSRDTLARLAPLVRDLQAPTSVPGNWVPVVARRPAPHPSRKDSPVQAFLADLSQAPAQSAPPVSEFGFNNATNAMPVQALKSANEFSKRAAQNAEPEPQQVAAPALPAAHPMEVPAGALTPVWRGRELLLLRSVTMNGRSYVQGWWLDWPATAAWLLDEVKDLLPAARLVPASGTGEASEHRLASLPVLLRPGSLQVEDVAGGTPAWLVLAIAWAGVLIAAVAIGLLLLAALDLSERRGAFVSAVTHELRTPLTTFRMYTEMLDEQMLPSPEQRRSYVATLRREAERLSHLVENVLSFSRVEEGRGPATVEPLPLEPFLERLLPRIEERVTASDMTLALETPAPLTDVLVRIDAAALEQILLNLVDNACKYAGATSDRRIHLAITFERRRVVLTVRDHGPGVAPAVQRRLFVPFSKSAAQAAVTAPGVGLGLALCRRLARSRGGDLRYEAAAGGGAAFQLSLPRA